MQELYPRLIVDLFDRDIVSAEEARTFLSKISSIFKDSLSEDFVSNEQTEEEVSFEAILQDMAIFAQEILENDETKEGSSAEALALYFLEYVYPADTDDDYEEESE